MEGFVGSLVGLFHGVNKDLIIFIISMLPLLESRGGLIAAALLNVDFIPAFIISILGNILPMPFVLLFMEKILEWLKKFKRFNNLIRKFEKKILSKREQIDKYGYLGLLLFVGIPLPGTGAWTGAALAVLLHIDRKKSFAYIALGVLMASVIMSILSYGLLDKIIH